jgi:hypothetical protein
MLILYILLYLLIGFFSARYFLVTKNDGVKHREFLFYYLFVTFVLLWFVLIPISALALYIVNSIDDI